jgi:hypothetical protein
MISSMQGQKIQPLPRHRLWNPIARQMKRKPLHFSLSGPWPKDCPRRSSLILCLLVSFTQADGRIDIYFEYIHPTFPILHKASFLSSLLLPLTLRSQSTTILRAIVSCAAMYSEADSRLKVSQLCKPKYLIHSLMPMVCCSPIP